MPHPNFVPRGLRYGSGIAQGQNLLSFTKKATPSEHRDILIMLLLPPPPLKFLSCLLSFCFERIWLSWYLFYSLLMVSSLHSDLPALCNFVHWKTGHPIIHAVCLRHNTVHKIPFLKVSLAVGF